MTHKRNERGEMTPKISLRDLRKKAEAATTGEWIHDKEHQNALVQTAHTWIATGLTVPDGQFISAAQPATVIALLDALERAREALDDISCGDLSLGEGHPLARIANAVLKELDEVFCE